MSSTEMVRIPVLRWTNRGKPLGELILSRADADLIARAATDQLRHQLISHVVCDGSAPPELDAVTLRAVPVPVTNPDNDRNQRICDAANDVLEIYYAGTPGIVVKSIATQDIREAVFGVAPEAADGPACENDRVVELQKALRLCLNALERGIEVRMTDQWPALKDVVPEAIQKAKAALDMTATDKTA